MRTEQEQQIFDEGVKYGIQHSVPSQKTLDLIGSLQSRLDISNLQMEQLQKNSEDEDNRISGKLDCIQLAVDNGFEKMNGRVKTLEKWRSGIVVGISLISMASGAFLYDYFGNRDKMIVNNDRLDQIIAYIEEDKAREKEYEKELMNLKQDLEQGKYILEEVK